MTCGTCGKNIIDAEVGEEFFLSSNNAVICKTCKIRKESFKYYIANKEVTKEEYDKFIDEGKI